MDCPCRHPAFGLAQGLAPRAALARRSARPHVDPSGLFATPIAVGAPLHRRQPAHRDRTQHCRALRPAGARAADLGEASRRPRPRRDAAPQRRPVRLVERRCPCLDAGIGETSGKPRHRGRTSGCGRCPPPRTSTGPVRNRRRLVSLGRPCLRSARDHRCGGTSCARARCGIRARGGDRHRTDRIGNCPEVTKSAGQNI